MTIAKLFKRTALAVFLVCTMAGLSQAQVLITLLFGDKLNSPNMEFGLHAGLNMSTLSNTPGAKYLYNLNLGFYFDVRITDKLWFHPELLVKTASGARNIDPYPINDPNLDSLLVDANVERDIGYFQVPLLLKYKLPHGFGIEAGIQPALRARVRDVFKGDVIEKNDLLFIHDVGEYHVRLDFGLTGGISWRPFKTIGTTIVARYTLGLVDILKDSPDGAVKNRAFSVGALIPIGVKKAAASREEKEATGESE